MPRKLEFKFPKSMIYHIEQIQRGEYDIPEYSHPRPVILDVGANVGGFAIWATARWPNCEIFCYEPVPDNFELLKTNIDTLVKTGVRSRIHINNFAIGNCSEADIWIADG